MTVVEKSTGQRSSGSPVDVRGPALEIVQRMGALEPIRAAATLATRLSAVDSRGRVIGSIPTQRSPDSVEVPRSVLASALAAAVGDDAEFIYGDTVEDLRGVDGGVDVTFEKGVARRFDLVVGADGLHSTVRRLAIGPEEQFISHLGMYIATVELDRQSADPSTVLIHSGPGRAAVIHPATGREGAAFIFRYPLLPANEGRDPVRQKQLVADLYRGMGWRVPEMLDRLRTSDDFYFDAVSRVSLDRWTRGRTVLLGDAANTVSLFGEGSSMAIIGAATLAQCLADRPGDVEGALHNYEQLHRRRLAPHHRGVAISSHVLVPATRGGVRARDVVFGIAAAATRANARLGGSRRA